MSELIFNDENEAWVAQVVASYGVEAPFVCAAEIFAKLGLSPGMSERATPAAAIEAAARALAKADLRGGFSKDDLQDAAIALEAAAPFMQGAGDE